MRAKTVAEHPSSWPHLYYRDTAKSRRIPCSTEGDLTIRADYARDHFGELLKSLTLPDNWREIIRRQMLAEAQKEGQIEEGMEREKERLKLKKVRTIKLYKEGYIEDAEFQGEMAAVELAIRKLDIPEVGGVTYDEVVEAGEHIPGMACTGYLAHPFGKSHRENESDSLDSLKMDEQPG